MNKQEYEQAKNIVDNAPDVAGIEYDELIYCQYFLNSYMYVYVNDERIYTYEGGDWHKQKDRYHLEEFSHIRQLSDIKTQIALYERAQELERMLKELLQNEECDVFEMGAEINELLNKDLNNE